MVIRRLAKLLVLFISMKTMQIGMYMMMMQIQDTSITGSTPGIIYNTFSINLLCCDRSYLFYGEWVSVDANVRHVQWEGAYHQLFSF